MDIAELAAVAGALGAVLVLAGESRRALLGGLVLLALAELGLAGSLSGGGLGDAFSPAVAGAGLLAALALGAAAWFLVRRPGLVPVLVLLAAPFRLPLDFDRSNALFVSIADDGQLGRLLPLYFVLAAAVLALVWRVAREREQPRGLPRMIALPTAAFVGFACISLLWAQDLDAGRDLLAYFTVPFAALLAVVARSPFPDWLPRALARVAIGLAALFAAIGLFQAAIGELFFFAPKLEITNANSDYFRVTSLFVDPSLYGRHVVLGLGVLLVVLALGRIGPKLGVALVALMFGGLVFSYSQSSMITLIVIVIALGIALGDRVLRRAAIVVSAVLVLGLAGFFILSAVEGDSLRRQTSDRSDRIEDTARVIERDPIAGVGIGGQPRATRRLVRRDQSTKAFVSHTTPLTVAAELGAVGLVLYVWLLVGGARLIEHVRRREAGLGLGLGVVFLGLFVHALGYSGFLEDPITWVVLAIGAAFLMSLPEPSAVERARERAKDHTTSPESSAAPGPA